MFLDVPIYIMNIPKRKDRYEHMKSLLKSIGVEDNNIKFSTGEPDQVLIPFDKNQLIKNKEITFKAAKILNDPYIANAVTQVRYIKKIADSGRMGIIMEDDIVNLVDKVRVGSYIQSALEQLNGKEWDMLFLEYCFEDCSKRKKIDTNIYKLYSPSCSAAILFSINGAKKVYKLCSPVFDGIDIMYPKLIKEGKIIAYGVKPTLFGQDEYFGSNALRKNEKLEKVHRNRSIECKECSNSNDSNDSNSLKYLIIILIIIILCIIFYLINK